ncbi:2-oxoacid:acceptor oxidoreductase family protein [Desulfomicrobium baculatum]|uniref:Pyruvate ferredoxin/flavodoxin oxidoreductase n=1 Tax=Desulfomicrobium baculatum (strain DSM 4028 / VKM B-1378 / X) TaxID=525897 RepID=C7LQJ3_DESBD|nr:2-oxoacid:acceptor oxidoreductase family protein [Desulfomicrobium baculatum]ACU90395.1 pyruvate ferredoxin/flavodoxin oxidoreductase [Desulfomicrobium baculatum DSM 4028]
MNIFNIHLCGVGGQGIGLLSEIILRAADHADHAAKAVDTHGLAQRGGIVVSQIRLGKAAHSPMIPEGEADLVVGLERHEALRSMQSALKDGGALVYYDTVLQPLPVRLGAAAEISGDDVARVSSARGITSHAVIRPDIADPRMQNIAVLSVISREGLIPGVTAEHYEQAMDDLLKGVVLEANLRLFRGD